MSWAKSMRVGRYGTGLLSGCGRLGHDPTDADMAAGTAQGKMRATAPLCCDHRHDRDPSIGRSVQRPPALVSVPAAPSQASPGQSFLILRPSSYRLIQCETTQKRRWAVSPIGIPYLSAAPRRSSPGRLNAIRPVNAQIRRVGQFLGLPARAYISSTSWAKRRSTSFRFTFRVGVSRPFSWVNSSTSRRRSRICS